MTKSKGNHASNLTLGGIVTMYRPTIRCSDVYKDFLDSLTDVTGLDRNQLIRLALFSAPFSNLFVAQLKNKVGDVPLPSPMWEVFDHDLWMEQNPKRDMREVDVNVKPRGTTETKNDIRDIESRRESAATNEQYRRQQQTPRQSREIPSRRISTNGKGGITIKIN
jgi:hypothetical protein